MYRKLKLRIQKFLQYETVLGPEDGDSNTAAPGAAGGDEEKEIDGTGGKKAKDNSAPISGPGLGDLHTVGEHEDVSPTAPNCVE
jgi:hypothetical protein